MMLVKLSNYSATGLDCLMPTQEENQPVVRLPDTSLKRKARKERARMLTQQREKQLKKAR